MDIDSFQPAWHLAEHQKKHILLAPVDHRQYWLGLFFREQKNDGGVHFIFSLFYSVNLWLVQMVSRQQNKYCLKFIKKIILFIFLMKKQKKDSQKKKKMPL